MKHYNQLAALGALVLALCLSGYVYYELVLYPNAGFPTNDFAVVVAGANTLRVGHWLKFGYTLSLVLLVVGLYQRLGAASPLLARLAVLAGTSTVILFLASGHLGLRILAVAEATYAIRPNEAITTILLRSVTIALFEAATFAVGWYALLVSVIGVQTGRLPRLLTLLGMALGVLYIVDSYLPDSVRLIAPLASIGWAVWLAITLWREKTSEGGAHPSVAVNSR